MYQKSAQTRNRTGGPTMATLDFTTKPFAPLVEGVGGLVYKYGALAKPGPSNMFGLTILQCCICLEVFVICDHVLLD